MALTTIPASLSATALTLTTAAQPNITSVGTLTGLTVSGNIAGTLTTAAQTNITSVGTLTGLAVTGNATFTTSDNTAQVTLKSTDTDAAVGPLLDLTRDSASPANNDAIGKIRFFGKNDASEFISFGAIGMVLKDVSDGSEDAELEIKTRLNGTNRSRFLADETETVINDDSQALDFRVESDNKINALFVKGADGDVGIGTASPTAELHVNASSENVNLKLTRDTNYGVEIAGTDGATNPVLRLSTINNGTLTERIRMSQTGLSPATTEAMGLGYAGARWNKLHVKTAATQDFYILGESTTADSAFTTAYFVTTLSGSGGLTGDRAQHGIYTKIDSSATGGDTSNEHRLYGLRSQVKATGDSDLISGGYFTGEAEHSSGTVSLLYGIFNQATADPNSGGTVSNTYGAYNQANINGSAGSTVTHAYAGYNRVIVGSTDAVAHSSLTGCYSEIETDASGTGRTTTNGYLFRGIYDDDSSAEHKFTNFYGLHLAGSNLATRVDGTGTAAGVYLNMPGVEAGFWNSQDQPNYFRGSLGIGSGSRQVGDTVGAELHLVEPDGGNLVLARYDASIGSNNSLGQILFGGTEDSGTTVNFSASIQAFAQSAHSTTDADGYLSFYTAAQSTTTLQEQLRIDRTGTIKVIRGDIQMPTGQGISFINANDVATGETVSSSVLNDYEEGTWTPVLSGGTTAGSFTAGSGTGAKYIKVGDLVHYIIVFRNCTLSGASGTIKITGLPFTTNTGALYPVGSALMSHAFNFDNTHQQAFYAAGSVIYGIESRPGTSWADWNVTNSAGLYLHLSFTHVSF